MIEEIKKSNTIELYLGSNKVSKLESTYEEFILKETYPEINHLVLMC